MPTKQLAEDEQLLLGIKTKGIKDVDPAAIASLYQQQPNRTIFGTAPYLALYYFGKKFYSPERLDKRIAKQEAKQEEKLQKAGADTVRIRKVENKYDARIARLEKRKEEGNFFMRIGEPPAIYDSTLMEATIDQIDIFMNSRGYFDHKSGYEKEVDGKKVYVTIRIEENKPYRYTLLDYNIPDSTVLAIVQATSTRSLLHVGDIYDEQVLSDERDRLYNTLRNNGFYDFAKAYIFFEPDTSYGDYSVRLRTVIQNPENQPGHRQYTIRNVYFKTDNDRFGIPRDTLEYNNIKFLAYDLKYSPKVLDKKVNVYPGQLYSQVRTTVTQRRLSELDVFQFNNMAYTKVVSPVDTGKYELNAFINAIPSKKFQETAELGMNFTERRPGPFSSIRLRVRNVFGGAENLDFGLRGGLEGQVNIADDKQTVMIRELGGDVGLSVPTFLLPFAGKHLLSSYNPRTRIYAGYTSEDRQEYQRSTTEMALSYIWQKYRTPSQPPYIQYILSPVNLQVVQADSSSYSDEFQKLIRDSQQAGTFSFLQSFRSAFISFISMNITYNTNDFTQTRNARFFRTQVEVGGLTQRLGLLPDVGGLPNFQYAKINPDYRRYIPLGNKRYFVYRVNAGVGTPLFGTQLLPYDKYFFVGGGTSVRAWQARRLGPGSYATTRTETLDNGDTVITRDYRPEQPGEVMLEGSVEYRFNIFSFLNGAVFMDAGNVWYLRKDPAKPGANFAFDRFYKELGVGTGFGFRFDLSVLILRFDIATKVYDPAGVEGNKFLLHDFSLSNLFSNNNQSNLSIGIGYPF